MRLAAAVLVGAALEAAGSASQPNILHILVDDFGWADASWHRPDGYKDLQAPNMHALVKNGVELDRHYVYKFCSPTRSAVQSGRNPIHVNVLNLSPTVSNEEDTVSGYAAVPRNMTGMAEHLLTMGYETHMYGKWDAGMATPQHTPHGRGYEKSLHYFHHANDYWTSTTGACKLSNGKMVSDDQVFPPYDHVPIVDLYDTTKPAHGQNNTPDCSQTAQDGCVYEDQLFTNRVLEAITKRNKAKPIFVFWAPHIVHTPLQVPKRHLDHFSFIDDEPRQYYHAMVYFVDEAIGNVTRLLKSEGMWEKTLIVCHADNGGPIYNSGGAGANNYPLKGGKMSNWDGGIRVNAFASGGFLPSAVRGTKLEGLMAGWDWYATFAHLAGADPTDHRAEAAGLPPIDSHNLWPLISGQTKVSPRTELAIGDSIAVGMGKTDKTMVGGLISGNYKILLGKNAMAGWPGPLFPNTSSHWNPSTSIETCGETAQTGCLFNIFTDPGEHLNLAKTKPVIFHRMLERAKAIETTVFSPERGEDDPAACQMALGKYGGFWGPFKFLESETSNMLVV